MKKVSDLETLIELIGSESVDRCFTEYMLMHIGKAKKLDALFAYIEEKQESITVLTEETFERKKRTILDVKELEKWLKE